MTSIDSSLPDVLQRIQEILPVQQVQQTQATPSTAPQSSFADALSQASSPAPSTMAGTVAATLPTATLTADTSSTDPDSAAAAPYASEIDSAGTENGVDPLLLQSLIQQESGFDPNATSAAGAEGLTQLMPQTAASLGVTNPYDPTQSIEAGAKYLRGDLDRFGGNTSLALAAYNAGAGAVEQYGGVPPYAETQNYVQQVLGRYQRLTNEGSTT
jgi:soluble lytic murein transglycosylase-like protein